MNKKNFYFGDSLSLLPFMWRVYKGLPMQPLEVSECTSYGALITASHAGDFCEK